MSRNCLLLLLLGAPATAQVPSSPRRPIYFETQWRASYVQVRVRPQGDTTAAWTVAHARREDYWTFEIIPDRDRPLPASATNEWIVEVRVPDWQIRDRNEFRGAVAGGLVATAAFLAWTTSPHPRDGPGAAVLIPYVPVAAAAGMLVGRMVGSVLPVREWQPVTVVR